MKRAFFNLALCGALGIFPNIAKADTVAVISAPGAGLSTSGSDQLYGWIFDALTSINVTALGVYESGSSLSISHDVGIYNQTTQALVASATVPAGTCALAADNYCFVSLGSSVLLAPGDYVIAMTMPSGNADEQLIEATSVNTASDIEYVNSAFDIGSSLHFPVLRRMDRSRWECSGPISSLTTPKSRNPAASFCS